MIIRQAIDKLEEAIDQLRQQIADMMKQAEEHVCCTYSSWLHLCNNNNYVCRMERYKSSEKCYQPILKT